MEESSEEELLMSTDMKKGEPGKPNWSRFGLSSEQQQESNDKKKLDPEDTYQHDIDPSQDNELFAQDQSAQSKPWWQANFFISEPVLFGTWDGVFTSCMITIFGVIIFLRTGWMVGNAGIGLSILIILLTITVALIAAFSAIGVAERCNIERGGVYFLMSKIMGTRIGASIGLLYCFGQAVAISLYVIGFGESISALINTGNQEWISKGIAIGIMFLLLTINVAGVKWVVRLQLILLIILLVAVLDFLVGSFVHTDWEDGFTGYRTFNLQNNTGASYQEGESFFTVFGVFFPTATGVFAGINMSGDLKNPRKNIPVGTLSAVAVSTGLYLSFAIVLGATCLRETLQTDYMIAEKVSVVGVLFLAGLYISSISSSMGGLYGSPRVLQIIAEENVIPIIKVLGRGRGPNKVPVYALCVITLISLVFIFIGNINTLGPIVTMPFLLTYAAVNYCYFALAMSFDKQRDRYLRYQGVSDMTGPPTFDKSKQSHLTTGASGGYGALVNAKDPADDLDNLFPERKQNSGRPDHESNASSPAQTPYSEKSISSTTELDDTAGLLGKKDDKKPLQEEITRQPRSFYSILCNRWLSLLGAIGCIVIMFCIQWGYALANISVILLIYIYIGQANPGTNPGIAEFNLMDWIKNGFKNVFRRGPPPAERIVVTPNTPAMNTMASQLTEDNDDFKERGRYHQSEIVKGDDFDDYDSE